jgi:hypothetical protein
VRGASCVSGLDRGASLLEAELHVLGRRQIRQQHSMQLT